MVASGHWHWCIKSLLRVTRLNHLVPSIATFGNADLRDGDIHTPPNQFVSSRVSMATNKTSPDDVPFISGCDCHLSTGRLLRFFLSQQGYAEANAVNTPCTFSPCIYAPVQVFLPLILPVKVVPDSAILSFARGWVGRRRPPSSRVMRYYPSFLV